MKRKIGDEANIFEGKRPGRDDGSNEGKKRWNR
jgi:hypothetical protein